MPHPHWRHGCCAAPPMLSYSPRCAMCGAIGDFERWVPDAAEASARYRRAFGLDSVGPHIPLKVELLDPLRVPCGRCGGSGFMADALECQECPACEGGGGVWQCTERVLAAAYRRILESFPAAGGVAGGLVLWPLATEGGRTGSPEGGPR